MDVGDLVGCPPLSIGDTFGVSRIQQVLLSEEYQLACGWMEVSNLNYETTVLYISLVDM
jgi:hypothetical protein